MSVTIIREGIPWRHALARCATYDFYHTWDFHEVSRHNGEGRPILFVVGDHDSGMLLPLLERSIPGTDWYDLTSVYGYPSPLIYGVPRGPDWTLALWHELMGFLRGQGYVSVFSRGHPMLTPEPLRGTYYKSTGSVVYCDCTLTERDQLGKYRRNHRQNIKKLRSVGVNWVRGRGQDMLYEFQSIYDATMNALGAEDYYLFSTPYYDRLLAATDFDTEIWVARLDDEPIAASFVISCRDFVAYHLSGTSPQYYKLAPSKLLIDEARRLTTSENRAYLVLGGGYNNKSDSLLNFKRGFSDSEAPFYLAKIVLDEERYSSLCDDRESSFFPAYRTRHGVVTA